MGKVNNDVPLKSGAPEAVLWYCTVIQQAYMLQALTKGKDFRIFSSLANGIITFSV